MELSGFGNVSVAAKFIHKYFPQEILNQDAIYNHEKLEQDFIKEPLFPYILRHTQLTPRQVIKLCNEITEVNHNTYAGVPVSVDEVVKGISKWEIELCREIFNSFRS
ncbi:MAG: hypothetical protein AAFN93_24825, partial [Bacteroidota bacterium]